MRFVGPHDDVGPVGQLWVFLAALGPKLLNEREQHAEVLAALGAHLLLGFGEHAGPGKGLVDLVVEIDAVGNNQERPVAFKSALHLL